jgi:hypothetical protein
MSLLNPFLMGPAQRMMQPQTAQAPGMSAQPAPSPFAWMKDPAIALPVAAALMGGGSNRESFANAMGLYGQAKAQTKQKNATEDFFRKNAPEYLPLIEAGMSHTDALAQYSKQRFAQGSDPYKVAGGQIFDTRDQSWRSPPVVEGPPETGLQPQMMVNPETGKTIYVQPTKDGRLLPSQVPEGFVPYDPYNKAYQTGSGAGDAKVAAETRAELSSIRSKMPGLKKVITRLDNLSSTATYTVPGQILDEGMKQMGMEPREAAIARAEYTAIISNQILPLLRDTFGAQFTEREGDRLMQTLGDPNASPKEKQALLKAFLEQKRRDVEALEMRVGGRGLGGGSPSGKPISEMTDEELEAIANGQR